MDLTGKKVIHKKYGEGVITDQDPDYFMVDFHNSNTRKKFKRADCFEKFLTLVKDEEDKGKESYDPVSDFCVHFSKELMKEIQEVKETGGKRYKIHNGVCVGKRQGQYLYMFSSEDELYLPEDTPISIWKDLKAIPGVIAGCEDVTVIFHTAFYIGEKISEIEISAEPWKLLLALKDQLEHMEGNVSDIAKTLICDRKRAWNDTKKKRMSGQEQAVEMSLSNRITMIWGPPGTGKTQTLARISLEHIKKHHRVLMVSYSNVSVDEAVIRIASMAGEIQPGKIIRYGYPRKKELSDSKDLTAYNLAIQKHKKLLDKREWLLKQKRMVSHQSEEFFAITEELSKIKKILAKEEKECVEHAQFVATTISKAVVDPAVFRSHFDVVIFDEASMAYIPQVFFAACLAKKHFICMGDFRQLPPIVQNSKDSDLNKDIFQYCKITEAVDQKKNHQWLCMLDTQYRMHPRIADFASQSMYGGMLKTAGHIAQERKSIVLSAPFSGMATGLADLSGMMPVCIKTSNNSRINILSALISMSLAAEGAKHYKTGVITPYHDQSRLLHAILNDLNEPKIFCATVHQFQGSEKDIILYDAVDSYFMPYPGMLFTSLVNDYANRLFNVAFTRAKGKFITVADRSYMEKKLPSHNFMFKKAIRSQYRNGDYLEGKDLIPDKREKNSGFQFFDGDGFQTFLEDLQNAKKAIRIDISDAVIDDKNTDRLKVELEKAKNRGVFVMIRVHDQKKIPNQLKKFAVEDPLICNPVSIIDQKITWFGMPDSGAVLQTLYRPVIRLKGKHTAYCLYGFLEMEDERRKSAVFKEEADFEEKDRDDFRNFVRKNEVCPSCGRPMLLKKSRNGRFFIGCFGYPLCNTTKRMEIDFVEQYLNRNGGTGQHCRKCNYSLEAKSGFYGVYVQCCGPEQHQYNLDEI